ncbi:hypothetical protein M5K25_001128 [Dendrobium thyrsiflorum]|uniref:Reverse transcriptase zinc-binding domain-containing protein n=1 Tax=Dendrobium thyrsiflorum TaxID=117978 RepID=A0ABD0VV79_DENTH
MQQTVLAAEAVPTRGWSDRRVQFLKFIIINFIAYWIRGSIIPKGCHKIINRLCSRPERFGGLSIPFIDSLYHGKYTFPWKPPNSYASKTWKLICNTALLIKNKISFGISKDSNLSMYWDPWCNGKAIAELLDCYWLGPQLVSNYISESNWIIPIFFPRQVADIILRIPIRDHDSIAWEGSSNFQFKNFTAHYFSDLIEVPWHKFIWHKNHVVRFSAYAWMALMSKLKTAYVLAARSIPISSGCPFCLIAPKSHKHLVIAALIPSLDAFFLRPNLFQAFDFLDSFQNFNSFDKRFCFLTICVEIYHIWREMNLRRFSNYWNSPYFIISSVSKEIKMTISNWKHYDQLLHNFPNIHG